MAKYAPQYLKPYLNAARTHGGGFWSLLWGSAESQQLRFEALRRMVDFTGKTVLDVGCGRADLLTYLRDHGVEIHSYIGLEAVDELADAAERACAAGDQILRCDFVAEPARMFTGSDIVVICGSLNTLTDEHAYESIRRAWDACAETLVFNFLCSERLAGNDYLHWRSPGEMLAFCQRLGARPRMISDYRDGDCTLGLTKSS